MRHLALAAAILGGGIPAFAQTGTAPVASPDPVSTPSSAQASKPADAPPSPTTTPSTTPAGSAAAHTFSDQVLVTASLEPETPRDLPVAVSVISASEIEARQDTQVLETLRTVPGLDVVQQGSPGKIASVFLRGTNSTQTLVLWNGVQLNDPSFGGFDWAFLDTADVDRIEVVRGPASALYGSEAIGGVIQVLTRREGQSARLRLEAGGDDHRRGSLAGGLALGRVHLELSGAAQHDDGELDNDFFDGRDAIGRLSWKVRDDLELQTLAGWNDSEVGLPFDFLGNPSPHQVSARTTRVLAAPVSWTSPGWQLEGQVFRQDSDFDTRDTGSASFVDGSRRGARAVLTRRLSKGLWIAGGGDWEREEVTTGSDFGPGLQADAQRTWSAFAQLHATALGATAHPLRIEAGLRRDDNDAFGTETSLRTGLVWEAGRRLRLHASYGEGFRAPSLGELFFPGFGNPDLGPETSDTWELGADLDRGRWRFEVAAFDTDLSGLIVTGPPSFRPFNVGRARSRGVEAEAARTARALTLRLQTTWLDTADLATGRELLRRPTWRSSLALTWRPGSRWTLDTVARWVGERLDLGEVTLASYTEVDLAGSWRARGWLEPYARIENLFDESYEETAGFPAPGRKLVAGAALRF